MIYFHRSLSTLLSLVLAAVTTADAGAREPTVTGIRAIHRDGQTFVTWMDAAKGEAGAGYRYNLYMHNRPITETHWESLKPVIRGILNHSGQHYGYECIPKQRVDDSLPTAIIEPGGTPLPIWSGLAVRTVSKPGQRYYAVAATDLEGKVISKIVAGESSTTEAVAENVAPIEPLKTGDSAERGRYAHVVKVTGKKNLPLMVSLHASSARGGPGSDYGDYYLFWGRPEWGYRDGLPWQFTVEERDYRDKGGRRLLLRSRETMAHPSGKASRETYWFGYHCVPQWADHQEPRAYNFTERRMLWLIDWTKKKYSVDPNRVYGEGQSMGGWGTTTFLLRHPDLFAAIYPRLPRTRQGRLPSILPGRVPENVKMSDGETLYRDRMDMVKFVSQHHDDLPFFGWSIGRHDGFATFKEQIDMVEAMTAAHHGFCFAWNNGGHGEGARPMGIVKKYYPPQRFARNVSYPAFGNSSINDDLGTGEVEVKDGKRVRRILKDDNGDLTGGINLGFTWGDIVDQTDLWSVKISNSICKEAMTVDVTPRRCQKFKPASGDTITWTTSAGSNGTAKADEWGLVTIQQLTIRPGESTKLTIRKTTR